MPLSTSILEELLAMLESNQKLSKTKVEIQVHLDDGNQFLGVLFVRQDQRISDLMNDERQFLPVEMSWGSVAILRKAVISKVVPLDQHIEHDENLDPYDILGVPRSVSDDDLTRFYRMVCTENHPDKVQASGLSPEFMQMANSRMIRINDAYERIVSMRRAATANDQESNTEPDR